MEFYSHILMGLDTSLTVPNLTYCFIGVVLGMLVGIIPGIGTLTAISLIFPITFYMDPASALIMLAGIWYGTGYGGRTAAILLNLPGSVSSAVTCIDGYPMAKQGRGGVALFITAIASFVGGTIGILILMFIAPAISSVAVMLGPVEYFSLVVLGLVAGSSIADGSIVKGLAMVLLGILLGTVGADVQTGHSRYTFGILELYEGISLTVLAMGLFGVAEVIWSLGTSSEGTKLPKMDVSWKAMTPSRDDMRRSWKPMLRASGIGSFFGALPGTGVAIAAFVSYAIEKKISPEPQRFGKGAIEGVTAAEAADNAAEMTSFVPTLSLGIPGSATMALMIGVMMIHGITPGPMLIVNEPNLFWGLIMSFWIGNVFLLVLNVPFIGVWIRFLTIPYPFLFPAILSFICMGAYSVSNSLLDVWMVVFMGALGYSMRVFSWPAAPVLLGFVLGPMLEENFRRALMMSGGEWKVFLTSPISAALLIFSGALISMALRTAFRNKNRDITPEIRGG